MLEFELGAVPARVRQSRETDLESLDTAINAIRLTMRGGTWTPELEKHADSNVGD